MVHIKKYIVAIAVLIGILVVCTGIYLSINYKEMNNKDSSRENIPLKSPGIRFDTVQSKFGSPAIGQNTGIIITPLKIIEDNTCPEGISCVTAGTVVILVKISSSKDGNFTPEEHQIELAKKIRTQFGEVTLTHVDSISAIGRPYKDGMYPSLITYNFTFDLQQ